MSNFGIRKSSPGHSRGFTLVEMLIVIAVIGIMSAIIIPMIEDISGKADKGVAKRNAQNICSVFQAAKSAGADFASTTKSGLVDEIIAGKEGIQIEGSFFQSFMAPGARDRALVHISYDADTENLIYMPDARKKEPAIAVEDWADWLVVASQHESLAETSGWWIEGMKVKFQDASPEFQYRIVQTEDGWRHLEERFPR